MKSALTGAVILLALVTVQAQDQEQKLVDRLLKPDTRLANPAQDKKFIADGVSIDKKANVKSFYVQDGAQAKGFAGARDYRAKSFDARPYYAGRDHAIVSTQTAASAQRTYPTWIANASSHSSAGADKKAAIRQYADARPFLDHGKSEKALQRQNPPMTIDQVRELLNKNK